MSQKAAVILYWDQKKSFSLDFRVLTHYSYESLTS
jgi:hypothetical protein